MQRRLTTAEAAERLGVKPQTLYAYVSRGLIAREKGALGSTFSASDVEGLVRNGRRSRALPPLVFPSALTFISDGHISYRGLDVVELVGRRRYEEVAEWLWTGRWPDAIDWPVDHSARIAAETATAVVPEHALPLDRMRVIAAVAGAVDDVRHDTTAEAAAATARRLIRLLVHALPPVGRRLRRVEDTPVAQVLWRRLTRLRPTEERVAVLDAALVLLADHELATSTLAVRAAAMVRADPYEIIGTGLNVLGGVRHGGASLALEPVLVDAARHGVDRALGARLRRGGPLEGFGHPIHAGGDPRTRPVLDRLDGLDPDPARRRLIDRFLAATRERGMPAPNVDAAVVALTYCAEMIPGSGQAIYAVARSAGWMAHALEQYGQADFMRTRTDRLPLPPAGP